MRRFSLSLSFIVSALTSACGSTAEPASISPEPDPAPSQSGDTVAPAAQLEAELVETARLGTPQKMKVRVDETGRIVKQALYHGDADRVPQAVRDAATKRFPGGKPLHYETEHYADLGRVYEVEVQTTDGKQCELAAKPSGEVVYEECRLDPAALPAPIKTAVDQRHPGARVLEAESKKGPGVDEVTVEVATDRGERYLRISPDGTIVQELLRIPAVIEVPLPSGS